MRRLVEAAAAHLRVPAESLQRRMVVDRWPGLGRQLGAVLRAAIPIGGSGKFRRSKP